MIFWMPKSATRLGFDLIDKLVYERCEDGEFKNSDWKSDERDNDHYSIKFRKPTVCSSSTMMGKRFGAYKDNEYEKSKIGYREKIQNLASLNMSSIISIKNKLKFIKLMTLSLLLIFALCLSFPSKNCYNNNSHPETFHNQESTCLLVATASSVANNNRAEPLKLLDQKQTYKIQHKPKQDQQKLQHILRPMKVAHIRQNLQFESSSSSNWMNPSNQKIGLQNNNNNNNLNQNHSSSSSIQLTDYGDNYSARLDNEDDLDNESVPKFSIDPSEDIKQQQQQAVEAAGSYIIPPSKAETSIAPFNRALNGSKSSGNNMNEENGLKETELEAEVEIETESTLMTSLFSHIDKQWKFAEVILIIVISAILNLVTIIGNIMVLISFKMDRSLQTVSNYFLLSLALADLLIGLISMPLYTLYLLLNYWPLGPLMCDIWLAIDYLNSNAAVLNMLIISFDRYFSVTRPLTYRAKRTTKHACLMISCAWILSLTIWTPAIFTYPYFKGRTVQGTDKCEIEFVKANTYLTFVTAILAFYIPVIIMIYLYWRIWLETKKRYRDLTTLFLVSGVGAAAPARLTRPLHSANKQHRQPQPQTQTGIKNKSSLALLGPNQHDHLLPPPANSYGRNSNKRNSNQQAQNNNSQQQQQSSSSSRSVQKQHNQLIINRNTTPSISDSYNEMIETNTKNNTNDSNQQRANNNNNPNENQQVLTSSKFPPNNTIDKNQSAQIKSAEFKNPLKEVDLINKPPTSFVKCRCPCCPRTIKGGSKLRKSPKSSVANQSRNCSKSCKMISIGNCSKCNNSEQVVDCQICCLSKRSQNEEILGKVSHNQPEDRKSEFSKSKQQETETGQLVELKGVADDQKTFNSSKRELPLIFSNKQKCGISPNRNHHHQHHHHNHSDHHHHQNNHHSHNHHHHHHHHHQQQQQHQHNNETLTRNGPLKHHSNTENLRLVNHNHHHQHHHSHNHHQHHHHHHGHRHHHKHHHHKQAACILSNGTKGVCNVDAGGIKFSINNNNNNNNNINRKQEQINGCLEKQTNKLSLLASSYQLLSTNSKSLSSASIMRKVHPTKTGTEATNATTTSLQGEAHLFVGVSSEKLDNDKDDADGLAVDYANNARCTSNSCVSLPSEPTLGRSGCLENTNLYKISPNKQVKTVDTATSPVQFSSLSPAKHIDFGGEDVKINVDDEKDDDDDEEADDDDDDDDDDRANEDDQLDRDYETRIVSSGDKFRFESDHLNFSPLRNQAVGLSVKESTKKTNQISPTGLKVSSSPPRCNSVTNLNSNCRQCNRTRRRHHHNKRTQNPYSSSNCCLNAMSTHDSECNICVPNSAASKHFHQHYAQASDCLECKQCVKMSMRHNSGRSTVQSSGERPEVFDKKLVGKVEATARSEKLNSSYITTNRGQDEDENATIEQLNVKLPILKALKKEAISQSEICEIRCTTNNSGSLQQQQQQQLHPTSTIGASFSRNFEGSSSGSNNNNNNNNNNNSNNIDKRKRGNKFSQKLTFSDILVEKSNLQQGFGNHPENLKSGNKNGRFCTLDIQQSDQTTRSSNTDDAFDREHNQVPISGPFSWLFEQISHLNWIKRLLCPFQFTTNQSDNSHRQHHQLPRFLKTEPSLDATSSLDGTNGSASGGRIISGSFFSRAICCGNGTTSSKRFSKDDSSSQKNSSSDDSEAANSHNTSSKPSYSSHHPIQPKSERKAAKTLSTLLLVFIVTWLPYNVLVLIKTLSGGSDQVPEKIWNFSYYLCYINSTINPLCYALCNAQFRRTYMRILKCKLSNEHNSTRRLVPLQSSTTWNKDLRLTSDNIPTTLGTSGTNNSNNSSSNNNNSGQHNCSGKRR